jgi:hypothetical protein
MNATLQTLGQSLGNWQAVYIVSIVVAVLSTFAIVVFAFHIQENKVSLKVSNYVYVTASLIAVLSTIIILNKTRSIDEAKDREVRLAIEATNLKIAQADKDVARAISDATLANQKAVEAIESNELERIARSGLEKSLAPRAVSPHEATVALNKLRQFPPKKLQLVYFTQSPESINFADQLNSLFFEAGWSVFRAPTLRSEGQVPSGTCFVTHGADPAAIANFENAMSGVISHLKECDGPGGIPPFASFLDKSGIRVKIKDVSPSEVIELWVGMKARS